MRRILRAALTYAAVLVLADLPIASPLRLSAPAAFAHDWYDAECCSGKDCAPARDGDVIRTPNGWLIVPLNITVPYGRARTSADDHFHYCRYWDGKGGFIVPMGQKPCLYVPLQAM